MRDITALSDTSLYRRYPELANRARESLVHLREVANYAEDNPVTYDVAELMESSRDDRAAYEEWRLGNLNQIVVLLDFIPVTERRDYLRHLGQLIRALLIPNGIHDTLALARFNLALSQGLNQVPVDERPLLLEMTEHHNVLMVQRLRGNMSTFDDYITAMHHGRAPKRHSHAD